MEENIKENWRKTGDEDPYALSLLAYRSLKKIIMPFLPIFCINEQVSIFTIINVLTSLYHI